MGDGRLHVANRGFGPKPAWHQRVDRPSEVTWAAICLLAGAGVATIAGLATFVGANWPALSGYAIGLAVLGLAMAAAWLVGIPLLSAFHALRGRRWPVLVATCFVAIQLFTIGGTSPLGLVSVVLSFAGCVLLWLPRSREFSKLAAAARKTQTVPNDPS